MRMLCRQGLRPHVLHQRGAPSPHHPPCPESASAHPFRCAVQYCCGPCIWGSAMEQAELGSCALCCIGVYCCPLCAIMKGGMDVASKYGIEEGFCGACMKTCCCGCCYALQIQNEVMVKEGLHYACAMVEKDGGVPAVNEMER